MKKEYALVLLKPDAMAKGLAGYLLDRLTRIGLELVAIKLVQVSEDLAREHYGHLKSKPFFGEIVDYLQGALHGREKVIAMVFAGPRAIAVCRKSAGATNPEEAHPLSIRGSVGRITTRGVYENVVHVSSDAKEARREITLWFSPEEFSIPPYPTKIITISKFKKTTWK